ncbi:MAG TPA: histidinol dehydrogenase, partial [Acetobacteraceae bacterium]|nr:histidinol dehydrogenase [Acetobacteraceae bacterium]
MIRLATSDPGFDAAFAALVEQARDTTEAVGPAVAAIIADVRAEGDAALLRYTERHDRLALTPGRLRIDAGEIDAAVAGIAPDVAAALELAATRIEAFHRLQLPTDQQAKDSAGLTLGMRW